MLKLFAIAVFLALPSFNRTIEQPATLVIERCSLFDSASGRLLPDQTVVVSSDRIVSVTSGSQGNIPARAIRIDGRGKYLLPGLIDAHVHLVHVLGFAHVTGDEVLPLYL